MMPSTGRDWNTVSGTSRSGRHIDKQEVHVVPYNVRPELLDGLRDDRTAVNNRIVLMRQYQIDRDHLYTAFAACRKNAFLAALELTVYAEGLGDRRTGDVGIQHTAGITLARHADAIIEVSRLLPTPPLPETTPMTFLTEPPDWLQP